MSVIVKGGGGGKPEEEKTVTAGTSVIEVLPSSGKTMKKVTVNPTPSQSKTVSPSTSQQTVSPDAGKLLSQVIVNAMASGALSDITVSTAGLITAQVGTSGYLASGTSKTKQLTTQAAKTWTPTTADQSISSGRYLTGKQTIKGDSNLLAANIKSGVSIFGVAGTLIEGVDLLSPLGCTKIAVDKFTFSSSLSLASAGEISHSLGEVPKVLIILSTADGGYDYIASGLFMTYSSIYLKGGIVCTNGTGKYNAYAQLINITESKFYNTGVNAYSFKSGVEYTAITMA